MARRKRALRVALVLALLLLAGLGAGALRAWEETRVRVVEIGGVGVFALTPLDSATVVVAVGREVKAVEIPLGRVRWSFTMESPPGTLSARDGLVPTLSERDAFHTVIEVRREGTVAASIRDRTSALGPLAIAPTGRPGVERLFWVRDREPPDKRSVRAIRTLEIGARDPVEIAIDDDINDIAASGANVAAVGANGVYSIDPATLAVEKILDHGGSRNASVAVSPRGAIAWSADYGTMLWVPGQGEPVALLDTPVTLSKCFDESGSFFACIDWSRVHGPRARLYEIPTQRWWRAPVEYALAVTFLGEQVVIEDAASGRLHIIPLPRAHFERNWERESPR
jgi:hypothetical protein